MPNVVLTGLPRSGSTLICSLLNLCADTVALHEPIPVAELARQHGLAALPERIEAYYADARHSLLTTRRAFSKARRGQVPDNTFDETCGAGEDLRRSSVSRQEVSFVGKELSPDFTLAIKHNAVYVATLERLVGRFPCRGIVRHPLAVLSSWNSVDLPVQQGYLPAAQSINAALEAALARIDDRTERQFYILEWFFERLTGLLGREGIVRYEDTVATGGRALEIVTPAARMLDEPLASKNKNPAYDPAHTLELGRRLLGRSGAFWEFYTRDSVEAMLAPLQQTLPA